MRVSASPYINTFNKIPVMNQKTQPVQNKTFFNQMQSLNAVSSSDSASIWDKLSQKYDVRNATIDEIGDISSQLYNAGQISLLDHSILSFDPGKSPQPIDGTTFLTPAKSGNKRDWIAEYQARTQMDLKQGDLISYKNDQHLTEILERIQS